MCARERGRQEKQRGLERGKGLLEGWQVVESEGTPFPCGLGATPIQSGSGLALYGSVCLLPRIDPSLLLHPLL